MRHAPVFLGGSQPSAHFDAMVTHALALDEQAGAPGSADGAANSENLRLIFTLFAFEGQKTAFQLALGERGQSVSGHGRPN